MGTARLHKESVRANSPGVYRDPGDMLMNPVYYIPLIAAGVVALLFLAMMYWTVMGSI